MARNVNLQRQYLDKKKAIRWYQIQDAGKPSDITHVLRIDIERAQPFVLGSILAGTSTRYGRDVKLTRKRTLSQIAPNAQKSTYDIRLVIQRQARYVGLRLRPLWMTNGTFFLDDCWLNSQPLMNSYMAGSIVDFTTPVKHKGTQPKPKLLVDPPAPSLGGPVDSQPGLTGNQPWIKDQQLNRGVFLLRLDADGTVNTDFRHSGQSARYWANQGYFSVIAGAGILIEDGQARSSTYMAKMSQGGFNGQWYCSGPVIATNITKRILYLIMDRTNKNNHPQESNQGRSWGNMAQYLKNDFLREIDREGDGSIKDALVYDGGSSRGLWIRKQGSKFGEMPPFNVPSNNANLNNRIIPHHFCLWVPL